MDSFWYTRILEVISFVNALVICFYTILWMLGTRDRLRILKLLRSVLSVLDSEPQKEHENTTKKGGDTL